jgi:hypothetical protein
VTHKQSNTHSYPYNLKKFTSKANEVRKLYFLNNALPSTDATMDKQQSTELYIVSSVVGQHYLKTAPVYWNRKSETTNTSGPQARPGHLLDMKQKSQTHECDIQP